MPPEDALLRYRTARDAGARRLAAAQRAELEQALLRMMVAGTVLVGFVGYPLVGGELADGARQALGFVVAYFGIAVALALPALAGRGFWLSRRFAGIALDVAAVTYFMAAAGAIGAAAFALYPFVAIGHGLRYGRRYLLVTQALSLAGIVVVCASSDFWADQPWAIAGLVAVVLAVPYYVGAVSGRLDAALRRAEGPRTVGPTA